MQNTNSINNEYNNYFKIKKQNESENEVVFITEIKRIIINHFEKLRLSFDYEQRSIIKGNLGYPMFAPKKLNPSQSEDIIFLSISKYSLWCQLIYQLSHELTHCFIYCHNKNNNRKIKWVEETICEATSLYFLKYFATNWNKCYLSNYNKDYDESIYDYLNDILKKVGTNRLSNCKDINELMEINSTCEEKREDRLNEMKTLYKFINQKTLIGLIRYRDFVEEGNILNIDKYLEKYSDNGAVNYLCKLQNNILVNS